MSSAFSGRPSPRSQSAMTGHSSTDPVIRRAAWNSARASLYFWLAYAANPPASRTAATRGRQPQSDLGVGVRRLRVPRREAGRPSPGSWRRPPQASWADSGSSCRTSLSISSPVTSSGIGRRLIGSRSRSRSSRKRPPPPCRSSRPRKPPGRPPRSSRCGPRPPRSSRPRYPPRSPPRLSSRRPKPPRSPRLSSRRKPPRSPRSSRR